MPSSVHGAELLDPLIEQLALVRGQHFGHISQCADQILADPFGIRKSIGAQLLERHETWHCERMRYLVMDHLEAAPRQPQRSTRAA